MQGPCQVPAGRRFSGCHWLISPHTDANPLEGSIVEIQQVVGIFLPIGAFLTPERAGARVVEELVRRLYRRLEQDGILASAPAR
jgi:hypothetical protein